jgi:hypothetical protein
MATTIAALFDLPLPVGPIQPPATPRLRVPFTEEPTAGMPDHESAVTEVSDRDWTTRPEIPR